MSAASFARISRLLVAAALFCRLTAAAQPVETPVYVSTAEDIALAEMVMQDLAPQADRRSDGELMVLAARQLLGQPYVSGTQEGRDEKLRVFLTCTDCILFAETCLGLVQTVRRRGAAATFEDLAAALRASRYRDGVVDGYASRLHYTTEWIAQGVAGGLFRDVTPELGGAADTRRIHFMTSHPDSYAPLKGESAYAQENRRRIAQVEQEVSRIPRCYISRERLPEAERGIRDGDILCFATSIDGLDYSHVVIAYRPDPGARLGFIHASSVAKKVIVEPRSLEAYLWANPKILGVTVLRVSE